MPAACCSVFPFGTASCSLCYRVLVGRTNKMYSYDRNTRYSGEENDRAGQDSVTSLFYSAASDGCSLQRRKADTRRGHTKTKEGCLKRVFIFGMFVLFPRYTHIHIQTHRGLSITAILQAQVLYLENNIPTNCLRIRTEHNISMRACAVVAPSAVFRRSLPCAWKRFR